jgi:hypothetical protein
MGPNAYKKKINNPKKKTTTTKPNQQKKTLIQQYQLPLNRILLLSTNPCSFDNVQQPTFLSEDK